MRGIGPVSQPRVHQPPRSRWTRCPSPGSASAPAARSESFALATTERASKAPIRSRPSPQSRVIQRWRGRARALCWTGCLRGWVSLIRRRGGSEDLLLRAGQTGCPRRGTCSTTPTTDRRARARDRPRRAWPGGIREPKPRRPHRALERAASRPGRHRRRRPGMRKKTPVTLHRCPRPRSRFWGQGPRAPSTGWRARVG